MLLQNILTCQLQILLYISEIATTNMPLFNRCPNRKLYYKSNRRYANLDHPTLMSHLYQKHAFVINSSYFLQQLAVVSKITERPSHITTRDLIKRLIKIYYGFLYTVQVPRNFLYGMSKEATSNFKSLPAAWRDCT